MALDRTLALPALRRVLSHRGLIAIDEQAIAFAAALAAFTSIAQPRAMTRLARCGQFFIHELAFLLSKVTNDLTCKSDRSHCEPLQRASDETRRIPLAFLGDGENVFGEYRARAYVVAVHVNEFRTPPRLVHRFA